LFFNGSNKYHIKVTDKYDVKQKFYSTSYNFRVAKIRDQNKFLGLVINGDYSGIAIGTNDENSGVTIDFYVEV